VEVNGAAHEVHGKGGGVTKSVFAGRLVHAQPGVRDLRVSSQAGPRAAAFPIPVEASGEDAVGAKRRASPVPAKDGRREDRRREMSIDDAPEGMADGVRQGVGRIVETASSEPAVLRLGDESPPHVGEARVTVARITRNAGRFE
jgi:hypothetical protein